MEKSANLLQLSETATQIVTSEAATKTNGLDGTYVIGQDAFSNNGCTFIVENLTPMCEKTTQFENDGGGTNFLFPTPAPPTPFGMSLMTSTPRMRNFTANFTLNFEVPRKLDFQEPSEISTEATSSQAGNETPITSHNASTVQLIDREFFNYISKNKRAMYERICYALEALQSAKIEENNVENNMQKCFKDIRNHPILKNITIL